jgi:hypothetical protein
MEERNEISVELQALSELVSGIGRQTPYGVPGGYFDQLPALVMRRIASGLMTFPAAGSTFRVPEGYFDSFAASVFTRIKASANSPLGEGVTEELARLSGTVSRISRETPYRLPEGYFEELSPVLTILRDKPAYAIPQGYFEELSPVLTVAHDRSTYQVPEGYFTGLPEKILEKVAEPAMGKVLKGNWWKFSSAAAIAACLLLIFSWPQVDTRIGEGAPTADVPGGLQKLSDQEIQAYLDDQHVILAEPANPSTATLDMNEGDVKSLLGEVSDNDLQQYMEEHGKADDLATN